MTDFFKQMDDKVNEILTGYMFEEINQETCDNVMRDLCRAFGPDVAAKVTLDTDERSIEVKMKDILTNIRTYNVSLPKKTKEIIENDK